MNASRRFETTRRLSLTLAAALIVVGCTATPPTDPEARAAFEEANDIYEPMNRAIFDFNLAFDRGFLKPAAKIYRDVLPDDARASLHNFLLNLRSPVTFANDLMQGEPARAVETLVRFTVNSVAGMGGLFDVAGQYGLERHSEDFGQTLAVWGFTEGTYIMLPVFGPSNPRDGIGLAVDSVLDPLRYLLDFGPLFARGAGEGIDKRSDSLEALDEIERTSVDFYATIRSLYRQRRADEIRNGEPGFNVPAPSISFEFLEDEAPGGPSAAFIADPLAPASGDEVSQLQ